MAEAIISQGNGTQNEQHFEYLRDAPIREWIPDLFLSCWVCSELQLLHALGHETFRKVDILPGDRWSMSC